MKCIYLLLLCCCSMTAAAQSQKAIEEVMALQTSAWNDGDISRFMQTYWNNDSLMFIGKNGVTYGWNNTLERYKKTYPDKKAMGRLSFTLIQVQPLGRKYYHVLGKWHLKREAGDLQGHFTLLFKKIKGKWLIIKDHTS